MTEDTTEETTDDRPTAAEPAPEPEAAPRLRSPEQLPAALEALLMIAEEPIAEASLAAAVDMPVDAVRSALTELARGYDEGGRGFELRRLAGGWRYYTREEHAELISAYLLEGRQARLSQAALETLAVIAYLQPVSRSRVSAVRGVSVDGVIRTLLSRDLITETGSEDSGATLFATTDHFLERLGITALDDLPELAPYLPEATELEAELGRLAVVAEPAEPRPAEPRPAEPRPAEPRPAEPRPAVPEPSEPEQSGPEPADDPGETR